MAEYAEDRQGRIRGRRQKRKLARLARLRRQVFRYVVLCGLLGLSYYCFSHIRWSVRDLDKELLITGNNVVSVEQVKHQMLDVVGAPLYAVNPQKLQERLMSLPAVHKAFVRRYLFPSPHIEVALMEEFPWASFSFDPEKAPTAVISETGKIIPLANFPRMPVPELTVMAPESVPLKEMEVRSWANTLAYIEAQVKQPVRYLDLRQPNDIKVETMDWSLRLGYPDSSLAKRLSRLASVLPVSEQLQEKETVEYVDLSFESNIPLKVSKKVKDAGKTASSNLSADKTITAAQTL